MPLKCPAFEYVPWMLPKVELPHSRMRKAGLSNRFCPSVCRLSVQWKNLCLYTW